MFLSVNNQKNVYEVVSDDFLEVFLVPNVIVFYKRS